MQNPLRTLACQPTCRKKFKPIQTMIQTLDCFIYNMVIKSRIETTTDDAGL